MRPHQPAACPDCDHTPALETPRGVNRREFVAAVGGAALSAGLVGVLPQRASAAPKPESAAEQAVLRLYKSLSEEQRKEIVLAWNDPRRTKISANWHITKAKVNSLNKEQQATVTEILKAITSPEGYEKFLKQMDDDDGGVGAYSVAIAGTPGEGKACFLLTGRHLTLRADGDTTENTAFGGPIIYGHGEEGAADKNLFFWQTKRTNELFQALDEKQRKVALLARAPAESAVEVKGASATFPGIAGADLSSDQRELLKKVLGDILSPYRKEDVDEVLAMVGANDGWGKVHMAFYQQGDIGSDQVWDIWRIESPTIVCHFRGSPHVHAYLNVAKV